MDELDAAEMEILQWRSEMRNVLRTVCAEHGINTDRMQLPVMCEFAREYDILPHSILQDVNNMRFLTRHFVTGPFANDRYETDCARDCVGRVRAWYETRQPTFQLTALRRNHS